MLDLPGIIHVPGRSGITSLKTHSKPSSQSPSVILGGQSHGPQASSSFLRGKKSSGTYETELNRIGKKYKLLSKKLLRILCEEFV